MAAGKAQGKVAKRYARALLESFEPALLDDVREKIEILAGLWRENSELQAFALNPAIAVNARTETLKEIAGIVAPGEVRISNLLALLLENKRLSLLPQVAAIFGELVDELRRALTVVITSAFELSEQERSGVEEKIRAQFGKLARIEWVVDPSILGGLVIRSGDKLLDSSVRGSLSKLRTQLAA